MVVSEEQKRSSPINQKKTVMMESSNSTQNVAASNLISPRFKSAAAMAGWDEEALLLASLIVEDTPDRDSKHKKRFVLNSKTPPTNSTRKRRAQRSPHPMPVVVLDLDEEETPTKDSGKKKKEKKSCVREGNKVGENQLTQQKSSGVSSTTTSSSSALPCIDKLREELSCAICLEICFEPSTTPCGHSFCKKCLRSAADKCGKKCPKCRQLISNGRSCTVNTVLWNTIQLLFPQEVEAKKVAAGALNNNRQAQCLSPETAFYSNLRNRSTQQQQYGASSRGMSTSRRNEAENDAALARRLLQREIDGQGQSQHGTTTRRTTRGSSYSRNQEAATSGILV